MTNFQSRRARHGFLRAAVNERGLRKPVTQTPQGEVCPKSAQTPTEWAQEALGFEADPKQKEVLNHTGKRLILNCARQWGKSTVVAVKALHEAIHNPGHRILVVARSERQAGLLIQKVLMDAAILSIPRKRYQGRQHSLELPNGSRIFAIAHSDRTAVGHTADVVIVDEAALVADTVFGAVLPSLTRTKGKLWLLSTPSGQTGTYYNIWHDEQRPEWLRVKATIDDSPYADKSLVEEQLKLFPQRARQDYYCEFVQPSGRLLTREQIDAMIDPTIEPIYFKPPPFA